MRSLEPLPVTVVMPRSGRKWRDAYAREAVASVHNQTRPVQLIVAHDIDREGPATVRNRALRLVETEYVAFLDDDDILDPEHCEMLWRCAVETGADVVYPQFRVEGGDYMRRRSLGDLAVLMAAVEREAHGKAGVFGQTMLAGNFVPVTTLCKVDSVRAVGGFPTGIAAPIHPFPPHPRLEDWGLWLRLLNWGAKFAHLPRITWTWRQWDGSTSAAYVGKAGGDG